MPGGTCTTPDLTTFCRLDGLGLEVAGQRLEPDRAVLACRVVDEDRRCWRCGCARMCESEGCDDAAVPAGPPRQRKGPG